MAQENTLKQALAQGRRQIGLWSTLANPVTTELVAGSGFDWILIDGEHSPNDLRTILAQLQILAAFPVEPVVRPLTADVALVKQCLDLGARSLLLPNINSVEEARLMVQATRYPPHGIRGVAGSMRAAGFGRTAGYHQHAASDICLILQIETPQAVALAEDIATIDGVDALFVGPSDLSTSMGHLLQPGLPEVQEAIASVCAAARRAGKPTGILAPIEADARRYLEMGFTLVSVGLDQNLLRQAADGLAQRFKSV